MTENSLLIVIPTYNEKENIAPLISEIFTTVPQAHILVVDDNSPDGTAAIVERLVEQYPDRLHLLKRPGKQGLAQAYLAAFDWGIDNDYDIFLEMDADFSHNPAYIPEMLEQIKIHDAVIGSRNIKGGGVEGWTLLRNFISKGGSLYSRTVLSCPIKDLTGGFNMWRKSALEKIGLTGIISRGYSFQIEMKYKAFLAGCSITEIPIIFPDRKQGKSKMSKKILLEALVNIWKIREDSSKKTSLDQFIKFALTGGLGTVTNLTIFFLFVDLLNLSEIPVSIGCFLIAVTQNYIINQLWSFKTHTADAELSLKRWCMFATSSLFGLAVNITVMKLILLHWILPYKFIAQACGIAAGMVFNFLISKFVIFKEKKMSINKQNKLIFIGLFILSFIVIFDSTYNPMNFRRMHVDSSVYVTIAQGITRGQLPYRDFVDNKGPLTYLFSAIGLRLGGFTGIWIIELILMCVSVFFAYKTALFFGDKFKAFLGTVFSFIVLLAFFSVNAGTGEYSLPFLMISLYIFTKYFFSSKQEVSFVELIILGICFSCAIMIQLNTFPLWVGFCLVIFIESVLSRRFSRLGKYVLGFCLGIVIAFVPILLYLEINGILKAFFVQVVFGGASRGFSATGIKEITKNFYIVINRNSSIFPLALGLFWTITKYKQPRFNFYFGYTISSFLMVLFLSFSSGDEHYNMLLVPFFVPALTYVINSIYSVFSERKYKNVYVIIFFCFLFSEGLVKYFFDISKKLYNNSGEQLIRVGRMIDENTKPSDKIISLGFNAYIYPFTQRDAASKYIYQGSGLDHIPGSREEFISDILTGKPVIIALFNGEGGIGQIMGNWHDQIFEMIKNDYRLLSDENGFNLFILKNR